MNTLPAPTPRPLQGEARPTMDGKNRITIPAEWREIIGGNEIHIMPSSDGRYLKMLPPAEMDRLRAYVNTLPGKQRTSVQRKIGYDSRCVRWDAQGRLVLPDEFCKKLNLSGEIVLAGADQTLEIWNVQAWSEDRAANDAIAAQALSDYGL